MPHPCRRSVSLDCRAENLMRAVEQVRRDSPLVGPRDLTRRTIPDCDLKSVPYCGASGTTESAVARWRIVRHGLVRAVRLGRVRRLGILVRGVIVVPSSDGRSRVICRVGGVLRTVCTKRGNGISGGNGLGTLVGRVFRVFMRHGPQRLGTRKRRGGRRLQGTNWFVIRVFVGADRSRRMWQGPPGPTCCVHQDHRPAIAPRDWKARCRAMAEAPSVKTAPTIDKRTLKRFMTLAPAIP